MDEKDLKQKLKNIPLTPKQNVYVMTNFLLGGPYSNILLKYLVVHTCHRRLSQILQTHQTPLKL